jgi:C4-dicarboxylate transporter DctM subunit
MSLVIFASLLFLIAINVPVVFALGLSAVAAALFAGDLPLTVVPQRIFVGLDSFPLLAAPLFILAGGIMSTGSMADRMVQFATSLVGHFRGHLAIITIVASLLFASVSGSATADTAAIGSVLIPAMLKRGYNAGFATSLQACAGSIGPIIPPSVVMIVYAWVADVSVRDLFLGGVVPGFLIAFALIVTAYLHTRGGGAVYEGGEKASAGEVLRSGIAALPALGLPFVIIGGFRIGAFTATEAAAIAVFYALVVELVLYRDISLRELPNVFVQAAVRSSVVMMIVAMAALLGWMLTVSGLPQQVAELLSAISPNKYVLLFWIMVLLILVGTIMEAYAAIILVVPLLLPALRLYEVDLVHFGVIATVNLCIGMVTPPLGVTLFVACSISKLRMVEVLKPLLPMLLAMGAVLLLITYVPGLVMFLPNALR